MITKPKIAGYLLLLVVWSSCSRRDQDICCYDISDSAQFTSIHGQFYKGPEDKLFLRTLKHVEPGSGEKEPTFAEFYHWWIPQSIDPVTFQKLDGFYSRDKNAVYTMRPTSGGERITELSEADPDNFKVIDDFHGLATDEKNIYVSGSIIEPYTEQRLNHLVDSLNFPR
jgi:hypothetical protein